MPTKHTRLSVTLDEDIGSALNEIARTSNKSLSKIAYELIHEALELREDMYLSKKADDRVLHSKNQMIPAKDVWKRLNIK